MSPDDVHQVRIEHATRTLGEQPLGFGVLAGPGFAVTTAAVLRDAGPVVALRSPGSDAPIAAEVVEVLGSDELALLEVAPGFVVPASARPIPAATLSFPAGALADQLLRFRRFGAAYLRAELEGRKMGGAEADKGEGSRAETASERAGGTQRTTNSAGERGGLLLAYLRERARTGRLDPLVTVPALEWSR